MKLTFREVIIVIAMVLLCIPISVRAEEDPVKAHAKLEERMRDEKRHDEQTAREFASRVRVARYDSVWRSPRNQDIDVFQMSEVVPKPCKAIALMTFDCATKDETEAVAGLIAKAKDLGADAIIMLGFQEPSVQLVKSISPGDQRVFRANALVYQSR